MNIVITAYYSSLLKFEFITENYNNDLITPPPSVLKSKSRNILSPTFTFFHSFTWLQPCVSRKFARNNRRGRIFSAQQYVNPGPPCTIFQIPKGLSNPCSAGGFVKKYWPPALAWGKSKCGGGGARQFRN